MPARWEHIIPIFGKIKGKSFLRNKNFKGLYSNHFIRITIDKNNLKNNNKIIYLKC